MRDVLSRFACRVTLTWLLTIGTATAADPSDHFEKSVRPLLIERCHKCHGSSSAKGGLRLDSRAAIITGGETGTAVVPGQPDASLLMKAVRHQDGLAMPPDGKLTETQLADLSQWIAAGAVWPGSTGTESVEAPTNTVVPVAPSDPLFGASLQLWLKADSLSLNDGDAVYVWPDHSGHGRDVAVTKGVRTGGVGLPGTFAQRSSLMGRPAVRFDPRTGFASSPQATVDIRGDAALTIMIVMNLIPTDVDPPYHGVLGIGNPANSGDPGKPLAALIQINRGEDHALHFAGGWNHDASLGKSSFQPWYGKPVLLTVVKQPGPMRSTTTIAINGVVANGPAGQPLEGRDGVPEIQHRSDIGTYLGKALEWCGSIQGDLGEVIVFNTALKVPQRQGVEAYLAERFGLWLDPQHAIAEPARFSDAELGFWAYQSVRAVEPPVVLQESWIKTPVDRFILANLEQRNIAPAEPADKRTLLRRVTFDLTGLPPTPSEVADFVADDSPQAFEAVVNRLLASPHYGERWARHWLDVVRYAESTANDANAVMRFAWRYRNYVIDAFNQDLPYDQFLTEQLAGDLLPSGTGADKVRRTIATGFLMIGPKALAETDKEQSRLDIVDDQIDVIGRSMLGLTIACARCHDHKFDAIRATDYYALAGILRSTEPFQDEARNATMWWEYPVDPGGGAEPVMVMAPQESYPRNLKVHLRGNRFTLGKIVPRGVVQVVAQANGGRLPAAEIAPEQLGSGRLELARWIVNPAHPLTARVMVNRVWQHHFGEGIVATSDNFGTRGERPSHPELLDWLARQFVESGWSLKSMHRLIVLSSTYQQSIRHTHPGDTTVVNPRWLASARRRRLSAEELRDAILAVSGTLDRVPGTNESGEVLLERSENINSRIRPNRMAADDPFYQEFKKRSIYLPIVRNMLPDVLALFDAADPNGVTAARNETTVASQSLYLLNNTFVREQSRIFAEHLLTGGENDLNQQIRQAHQFALGREPDDEELADSRQFIESYIAGLMKSLQPAPEAHRLALQSFCQSLLCSNEFLYVD